MREIKAAKKKPNAVLKNRNMGIKPHAVFKIFDRFNAPNISSWPLVNSLEEKCLGQA